MKGEKLQIFGLERSVCEGTRGSRENINCPQRQVCATLVAKELGWKALAPPFDFTRCMDHGRSDFGGKRNIVVAKDRKARGITADYVLLSLRHWFGAIG